MTWNEAVLSFDCCCLFGDTNLTSSGLESNEDYEYVGLYPHVHPLFPSLYSLGLMNGQGSPHWDNNFCKADEQETGQKAANAKVVPVPELDPVFGAGGPLIEIWNAADGRKSEET